MSLRTLLLIGLAVVLLVIASDALFWARSAASRIISIGEPAADATRQARGFFATLADIQELRKQVSMLQSENAQLRSQVVHERETLVIGTLEERQRAAAEPFGVAVAAHVVHRSPNLFLETLTINRGTKDGLYEGAPSLSDGTLVGVVERVEERRATVRLVTSSGSAVPVRLQDSRAQGLLRGGLGGIVVGDLPADAPMKEGEPVLTSGLGGALPAGLPVGYTGLRLSEESEILQRITLVSPVPFGSLEVIAVLTDPRGME